MAKDLQRLHVSIASVRWLAHQGLAFRGHDESADSSNRGNFLELLELIAAHNPDIASNILENAPGNRKYTSPKYQKDISRAYAAETLLAIQTEIDESPFCILVDESADVSCKEQMAVVIRFIRRDGVLVERFLGLVHVEDTCAATLFECLQSQLARNGLSPTRIRGQGFDGASNMRGEFSGLRALIQDDNPSAHYIHCFAHQLQLTLVAAAKENKFLWQFFSTLTNIINVSGASCKRRDELRVHQAAATAAKVKSGELETGKGKNQELCLKRPGDTRWSSHYGAVANVIAMFPSVGQVLKNISKYGVLPVQRAEAAGLCDEFWTFDFVLHCIWSKPCLVSPTTFARPCSDVTKILSMR